MASRSAKRSVGGQVRYAVVGLGHIAQVAVLPAFAHARNSVLAGLVSGTPAKLKALARKYRIQRTWSYEQYDECLHSGAIDAVFIALPNDMHHEYAIHAARAGIHILSEKPLAVATKDCEAMIREAKKNRVKLMTAYRLHNEEANLRAAEIANSGKIGELRYFTSSFSFEVTDPDNIRLKKARGGGTVYDIGVYCINAARYIFRAEPIEVFAFSANNGQARFREVDEMSAAVLRFPGERLASFVTSFGSAETDFYEVVGTKGSLRLEPAFEYVGELAYTLKVGEKEQKKTFARRDQFGAEISYFSRCVLQDREPEPSGEEGLIDVRIVEALYKSAKTGRPVKLGKFPGKARPSLAQQIKLPPIKKPDLVKVESPHD
jgi:predicted dehydrogenase